MLVITNDVVLLVFNKHYMGSRSCVIDAGKTFYAELNYVLWKCKIDVKFLKILNPFKYLDNKVIITL